MIIVVMVMMMMMIAMKEMIIKDTYELSQSNTVVADQQRQ
jgi:hypothetical protein